MQNGQANGGKLALPDVAPPSDTLHVNGTNVAIFGVSSRGVASLLKRFPELEMMLMGGTPAPDAIIAAAPEAIEAIIAAGIGHLENKDAELWASRMPVELQFDFIEKIANMTLPSGFGPFVARLEKLKGLTAEPAPQPDQPQGGNHGTGQVSNSPPQ